MGLSQSRASALACRCPGTRMATVDRPPVIQRGKRRFPTTHVSAPGQLSMTGRRAAGVRHASSASKHLAAAAMTSSPFCCGRRLMRNTLITARSSKGLQASPQTPSRACATTPPPTMTSAAVCKSSTAPMRHDCRCRGVGERLVKTQASPARSFCTDAFCRATPWRLASRSSSSRPDNSGSFAATICAAR